MTAENSLSLGDLVPKDLDLSHGVAVVAFNSPVIEANIDILSAVTAGIASDGFGEGKIMSPQHMARKLLKDGHLVVAVDQDKEPIGFLTTKIFEAEGERFMHYSRAINKSSQGWGITRSLIREAVASFGPTIATARSQNPIALYSSLRELHDLGAETVYPFDALYSHSEKSARLLTALAEALGYKDINMQNGLQRKVFEEGRLGDYQINLDHPGIAKVEQKLQEIGLNREEGDAVVYMAIL